nr:hypothetical protein [uncultured Oscillibacter sp.]
MNKKYNLLMLLALTFLFTLSACGGQTTMEGGTTDPGQIVEGDTGDNGDVTLDQLSDTNKTPIADAEEVSTQEPYIVSLDDIPADLLGAFEYGYSTVHSEKPDLDEAERLEMELDLICQWCDSFVIAIPDNLNEVYSEWHAQYEAALNAIDEGTSTGSTAGTNSGTQSGTVDDTTPPSNNNSNSSSGNTGSTSKPSGGSSSGNTQSNPSTGSSSSGSNSNGFTPPSDEELEAAFGEAPIEGDDSLPDVGDGSGIELNEDALIPHGTQGTISW